MSDHSNIVKKNPSPDCIKYYQRSNHTYIYVFASRKPNNTKFDLETRQCECKNI